VLHGHSPDAIITRVERQIAGRDLAPLGLTDFASLKRAPMLSPFDKVVFYEAGTGEPAIEDLSFLRWTVAWIAVWRRYLSAIWRKRSYTRVQSCPMTRLSLAAVTISLEMISD
jgi:hypothetical protein